jgi:hypothetical protein
MEVLLPTFPALSMVEVTHAPEAFVAQTAIIQKPNEIILNIVETVFI